MDEKQDQSSRKISAKNAISLEAYTKDGLHDP